MPPTHQCHLIKLGVCSKKCKQHNWKITWNYIKPPKISVSFSRWLAHPSVSIAASVATLGSWATWVELCWTSAPKLSPPALHSASPATGSRSFSQHLRWVQTGEAIDPENWSWSLFRPMAFSKYCLEDLELPRWMVAAPCNITWPMTILDRSLKKLQASSLRQFESIKNPLALNLRVLVNFWSFVSFGLPFQCVLHTFLHLNPETVTCKTTSANSQVGTLHCLDCYGPNTSRATRKGVCFWIVLLRLLVHSKIDICNLNTHLVCPKKRNPEIWWFIIIFQCNPSLRQDHVNLQQCIRSFPLCLPFFFLAFCPAALPVARFHNGVQGPRHPCVFLVQSKFSWVWLGPVKMPTSCLSEPLLVRFLRFVTRFHGVDFSGHSLKRANRCVIVV